MESNPIRISDAHARVIQRGHNNQYHNQYNDKLYSDLYDNLIETDPSDDDDYEYLYIRPTINNSKKQKTISPPIQIDSFIRVKNNDNNTLRFNLSSSVFNSNFDAKKISKVSVVKNLDSSVDFIIRFMPDPARKSSIPSKEVHHYPSNSIYKNYPGKYPFVN